MALGVGGALETVIDGDTGILFTEATTESLSAALDRAAATRFDGDRLRRHAEQFSTDRHVREMKAVIEETTAAPAGARW